MDGENVSFAELSLIYNEIKIKSKRKASDFQTLQKT